MSKLFLPQQLRCIPGTNTFYVMILDTVDRSKDFGRYVPLQVANHLTQCNYESIRQIMFMATGVHCL